MVRAGWEVHCLNITAGANPVRGVTYTDWCHADYRSEIAKLRYFPFGLKARSFMRRLGPDLVHAHYASSAGLVACMSGYRPYAVTIHGSDLLDFGRWRLGRYLLRRVFAEAALINPVAAHMVPHLHKLGVRDDKILALPFGIELAALPFRPRPVGTARPIRLICTRSHGKAYDIGTILKAVAILRDSRLDVTLNLPAKGPLSASLQRQAVDLAIGDRVRFGEGYNSEQVGELLAAHDLYVSASHWDGASLSLMEAMACGILPIVSDIPANREWIQSPAQGLLFRTGDAGQLAEHIRYAATHPPWVQQALAANRALVESRGERARNMRLLLARLEQVAGKER